MVKKMMKFKMPIRNVETNEFYTLCQRDNEARWFNLTKKEFIDEGNLGIFMKALLEQANK